MLFLCYCVILPSYFSLVVVAFYCFCAIAAVSGQVFVQLYLELGKCHINNPTENQLLIFVLRDG